jgi:RNA polymerase sigma factor (sigma-70 family)
MEASPSTRYSLLLRIQDPQNHAAWVEFLALYEPLVYRLARRKGLQDADAHDLCQEVFRAVAQAAHLWTPDPARGSFRGWLQTIARNLLLNFLRRERRHGRLGAEGVTQSISTDEVAHENDEHAAAIEMEHRRRLFQVAAESIEHEFTRSTWLAFWRTSIEAHAVGDVAAELGISPGAVYIARSRVLARLRKRVEELEE